MSKNVAGKLPKNAISKISLGQSFAEYDIIREHDYVFVKTPAIDAALDASHAKCFYVGRRGTGKTAITYYLLRHEKDVILITPQVFEGINLRSDIKEFKDTRQRPFKSLVTCFQRAIIDEIFAQWIKEKKLQFSKGYQELIRERNYIDDYDFDFRVYAFIEEILEALTNPKRKDWFKLINREKVLIQEIRTIKSSDEWEVKILIDRIDELWDGSDEAVVLLMSLMHACVILHSQIPNIRPILFLRENIFERVRQIDNEFARLETAVVPLDWTREQLIELIERRLNLPFYTKLSLGGETWDYFFEKGSFDSKEFIFSYCQYRPRDILIYCGFAIESAQSHKHNIVKFEDIQEARRRFSDSRLKDLGDEYAENYPQIQHILNRFYGLGNVFTLSGIEAFLKKLLLDEEIKKYCSSWIYRFTTPHIFIELLYNIGFLGIKKGGDYVYRSVGPRSSTPPPISESTLVCVHPSYVDALNLRDTTIMNLDDSVPLKKAGILTDIPEDITFEGYQEKLQKLIDDLKTLPCGKNDAGNFENIIGDIIRLCFFRSLTNVEPKSRNVDGIVIRDWIAANRAQSGFWEMIRHRYNATQVIWECKNYEELNADDFHQTNYYINREIGKFSVIAFRGQETKKSYYTHLKRISNDKDGVVLLLNERDLLVFLRQALKGKVKEDHIHQIYDKTIRGIS